MDNAAGELKGWDLGVAFPERKKPAGFVPDRAVCAVCGKPISDKERRLFGACDFWRCRAERRATLRKLRAEREDEYLRHRAEFSRRMREFRDKAAVELGIEDPDLYRPIRVPASGRPLSRLSGERMSALRDHLMKLILDVREEGDASQPDQEDEGPPEDAPDADSRLISVFHQACAVCRGHCCRVGGNLAYLDRWVMSKYLAEHPDDEREAVISEYLSLVPEETCEDSCAYHGDRGCGLPREMRASTCNGFECEALDLLGRSLPGDGPHRVFLAGTQGRTVARYAFVTAGDRI